MRLDTMASAPVEVAASRLPAVQLVCIRSITHNHVAAMVPRATAFVRLVSHTVAGPVALSVAMAECVFGSALPIAALPVGVAWVQLVLAA